MTSSTDSDRSIQSTLGQWWLVDVLRLHEQQQQPLPDTEIVQHLARQTEPLNVKLHDRARQLAITTPYPQLWRRLTRQRQLLWLLLPLLALLAGLGLGNSALMWRADGTVSIPLALLTILLPHVLLLLLWFVTLASGYRGQQGTLLSKGVMHLGHWLWREPEQRMGWQALMRVLHHQRLLKPLAALLTHSFWSLILFFAILTLAMRLALQEYTLTWPTTILTPGQLEHLAQILGWLPALLGVYLPAMGELPSAAGQSAAGYWLLISIVLYGLGPRLIFLLLSWGWWRHRLKRLAPDWQEPDLLILGRRLAPATGQPRVTDREHTSTRHRVAQQSVAGEGKLWVSLDLPAPANLLGILQAQDQVESRGCLADRVDREQLLARLAQAPVAQMLVVVNTRLTPDRGSQRFLRQVAERSGQTAVLLVPDQDSTKDQSVYWREWLATESIELLTSVTEARAWLQ